MFTVYKIRRNNSLKQFQVISILNQVTVNSLLVDLFFFVGKAYPKLNEVFGSVFCQLSTSLHLHTLKCEMTTKFIEFFNK